MKTGLYLNIKNEKRIIEFIKYYIKIGIDYFIILDDDSIIDVNEILIDNNIPKEIYNIIYTAGRKFLWGIYNSEKLWNDEILPLLYKNNIDYVLYVDADEFLYIGKFKNMNDLIKFYSPFDSLKINWLLFGSNNLIENKYDSIISQFNKSALILSPYVKCLTKVNSICTDKNKGYVSNPHVLNVNKGITKNILNEIVDSSVTLTQKISFTYNNVPIYIAHYMCQDITTYIERKICSKIFLQVSQNYKLSDDIIKKIYDNKMLIILFFINKENNNNEINSIHLKTLLPKDIIIFLKKHYYCINNNEVINNDIINFYNS